MLLRPALRVSRIVPRYATTSVTKRSLNTPPFPTIPQCPSPACACASTPELPPDLPIEYNKPLNGTMAAYAEQVLVCTGKDDWVSRIEEENSGDNLAADIKELMGRGGIYSDVRIPVIIFQWYRRRSMTDALFTIAISQCVNFEFLLSFYSTATKSVRSSDEFSLPSPILQIHSISSQGIL